MNAQDWHVSGEFVETCSCDFLCPCLPANMAATPTKGYCIFTGVFHIERGQFADVPLDGLNFAVFAHTPGRMDQGDWTLGMVIDERADDRQAEAIGAIASGRSGGPMAALAGLLGTFAGIERRPIRFEKQGLNRTASIPELLDMEVAGLPSVTRPGEPLIVDNTLHPANPRLALARATRALVKAFGLAFSEPKGGNNGHFAPFAWSSAA